MAATPGTPRPTRFGVGGVVLAGHLVEPPSIDPTLPGLVLCHGFPPAAQRAEVAALTFPDLAQRIANEVGWVILSFAFRGAGESTGDFSLGGWAADLDGAIHHLLAQPRVHGVWLAGFGTGGALSVCVGARRTEVRGVATLAAPADFDDWASHPRRLLQHAREVGLIRTPGYPASMDAWSRELRAHRPILAVRDLAPRPLMAIHGSEDEAVPSFDARVLSDSHGSAELRIIAGAGHRLRHDPRAMAMLLGWLDRQKHAVTGT
ncbi:MAG: hypothetical protein HYX34_15180 [Actinobacteria bacterium]|nr:hypothetical protein [Actinomycetota bacterium]